VAVYIPIWCEPWLIWKEYKLHLWNPLATTSWNHLQYWFLASYSGGKCCTALILYGHSFKSLLPSELRILTPQCAHPSSRKMFWGSFRFDCQYHDQICLLLKHNILIFSFCQALNLLFEIFPILWIVILRGTVDAGFFVQNFWWLWCC
jgi:hypothetical protein